MVQSRNTLTLGTGTIIVDVDAVWRIVAGSISEVWDVVPG